MRTFCITLIAIFLSACATSPRQAALLAQSQRDFNNGFYKRAQENLLPVASEGNAEAEYALGYLYYYGYGVAQDAATGKFWIMKAAQQNYLPAKQALTKISIADKLAVKH